VGLAGITRHLIQKWMTQMRRNAVDEEFGDLRRHRYCSTTAKPKFSEFRKTHGGTGSQVPDFTARYGLFKVSKNVLYSNHSTTYTRFAISDTRPECSDRHP
jgi:hypothetical protein